MLAGGYMKTRFCTALLLSLLTNASIAENVVLSNYSDGERGEVNIVIEADRLPRLPNVNIEQENPPVTITQAVAAAKAYIYKRFPKARKLEVSEIVFASEEYAAVPNVVIYLYEVRFYAYNEKEKNQSDRYEAFVAMDGRPLLFEDNNQTANKTLGHVL